MKMKKILFSVFMFAALVAMAIVGFNGLNKVDAATATETEAQALLAKYWNNGVYTKQSSIKVTEKVRTEQAAYFHAKANDLERVTYYNVNELWMTNSNGVNSGYGTSAEGMTHFTKDASGNNTNVKLSVRGTTMEAYYVTLNDIKTSIGWTKSGNVYTSTDATTLDQFRQFVAPMWLSSKETSNYVTFTKATIEQTNAGLVMKLYVGSTDSAKVTTAAESGHYVFAQAIVTRDLYSVLVNSNRYYLDLNDNSTSGAKAEYMVNANVSANATFSVRKYHFQTISMSSYSGNFKSQKFVYANKACDIYVKLAKDGTWSVHSMVGKIYLSPNMWNVDGATYSCRFWVDGSNPLDESWQKMVDSNGDGIYEVDVPDAKYNKVIICRMNPKGNQYDWSGKWNQSGDLTISSSTIGMKFTPSKWDDATGNWS